MDTNWLDNTMRIIRQTCLCIMLSATCTTITAQNWVDVTNVFITNPGFDNNNADGWQWESDAESQTVRVQCMEFWNGTFTIWQDLKGLPKGKYRLSVQSYYRTTDNSWAWNWYNEGQEEITAYMFAKEEQRQLASVYSYSFPSWVNGCWSRNGNNYPNTMESARVAFDNGAYWNTLEFEAEGDIAIGLENDMYNYSNWCIFDNFKLEFSGQIVTAQSVSVSIPSNTILIGETMQCTATVLPANTLNKSVVWTSSNPEVATIDDNGVVTGISKGATAITATTTDGSNKSARVIISVKQNEASVGSVLINEIMASNVDEFISPAFNFDGWIELYNPTENAVQLTGLILSDGQGQHWTIHPQIGVLRSKGYSVIWFDSNNLAQYNVPFKLDVDGGTITIATADGTVLDSQTYPPSLERTSYARTTDGGNTWGLTSKATPGATNNNASFATAQIPAPVVDLPSQLFSGQLTVNVTIPAGCTLRYTTDGSLPTESSAESKGQFIVNETTCLRLRLFAKDMLASPVTSRSYIYKDRDYYLPVVSVISDHDFLYSKEIGVMEKGPNGRPGNGQSEKCNWNMDWERPVNFSFLDAHGDMVLNQDVNLEMCGGWSRAWSPHSFKLKGSKELGGNKNLPYPFFKQKPYIRNRTLQIRNGGNDNGCRFKDASLTYILQTSGIDIDVQGYQPIHEFINGNYIGVLNMREPNNKHYVYANYGWDDDEIDQFEMSPDSGYVQRCGTPDAFDELVDVLSPSAANSETYQEICQRLDIEEYVNYMAAVFYLGSNDWPNNNIKGFRNRNGGKFRFVVFDVDHSFNTNDPFNNFMGQEVWTFNELYPSSLGHITQQIKMVTLFKNLLKNAEFRRRFIDVFCLMGGSVYEAQRIQAICDELYNNVQPAMELNWESSYSTYNTVRQSLTNRLNTSTTALKDYYSFNLSNVATQRVALESDAEGAQLFINNLQVPTGRFNGNLFAPVTLKAVAPAGYEFQGWKNLSGTIAKTIKAKGSYWYYYDQGSLDGKNWMTSNYNISSWRQGKAPLGYSNNQSINTQLDYGGDSNNKHPTYYFRSTITLDKEPAATDVFTLDYYIDDGLIIYVNGTEAGRFNMPSGNVSYNTFATTYADQFPEGTLNLPANLFHKGSNVIAVEVHNNNANSTDIIFDAAILHQTATEQQAFYSTEQEIPLPSGTNLQFRAYYRKLTSSERLAKGITPVRINEVSASNSAFINEYQKKNDWVELFNTTDAPIDVAGMYLSNDSSNPSKYLIAKDGTNVNTLIPAHGYLLIWCDKLATTNEALHAPFKISGDGGVMTLMAADRSWTDKLVYGPHDGNTTVGRYPDGSAKVYAMNVPTIAKSNLLTVYGVSVDQSGATGIRSQLIASANGFRICYGTQTLLVKSDDDGPATVEIYTTDGRLLERRSVAISNGTARLSVAHLPAGFYVARATNQDNAHVSCKFVK